MWDMDLLAQFLALGLILQGSQRLKENIQTGIMKVVTWTLTLIKQAWIWHDQQEQLGCRLFPTWIHFAVLCQMLTLGQSSETVNKRNEVCKNKMALTAGM
jgi:hypothetical protein